MICVTVRLAVGDTCMNLIRVTRKERALCWGKICTALSVHWATFKKKNALDPSRLGYISHTVVFHTFE